MAALAPVPAAKLSPAVARIAGFMQNFSVEATPGRNDPCPCGSGKKFKKCHGA